MFWCQNFGDVCSYYFKFGLDAEWPPFGKELSTMLTIIHALCILTICNFNYFPFWFEGGIGFYMLQFLVNAYLLHSILS